MLNSCGNIDSIKPSSNFLNIHNILPILRIQRKPKFCVHKKSNTQRPNSFGKRTDRYFQIPKFVNIGEKESFVLICIKDIRNKT